MSLAGRVTGRYLLALILVAGLALRVWYAVHGLHQERFWDERYALQNVVGVVALGTVAPQSSYYPSPVFTLPPSALVAASNALYRATGDERLLAIDAAGRSRIAAYLLVRLLTAVYGTLAIGLLFLVGRRLFSVRVGLLAAAMLAFMPWPIHASGYFKPDALLLLTILLALWASLRAVAGRRPVPFLIAGLAIALAVSAKLTGALAALPLVAATLVRWREPRRWGLLAAAGLSSVTTFILLNPYWWHYHDFLAGLRRDYASRAAEELMTRGQIPGRVLGLVLGEYGHGPLLGVIALAGFVALAVRACRRTTTTAERAGLVMLLVYPPAYVAVYAAQTAYFKPNNFLSLFPFTALAAAWLLIELWQRAGARWPALASRRGGWAAACLLALLLVAPGYRYAYRSLVPRAEDLVHGILRARLKPPTCRTAVLETAARQGSAFESRNRFRIATIEVERLDDLPNLSLDLADAEVFAERHLRGRAASFYQGRIDRLEPDQVFRFRPSPFRIRGPGLVALIHRRRQLGATELLTLEPCDGAPACFQTRLPADLVPRERFSLELSAPRGLLPETRPLPPLRVGDRSVDLVVASGGGSTLRASTARLFLEEPGGAVIRLELGRAGRQPPSLALCRWAGGPRTALPVAGSKRRQKPARPPR